MADLAQEVVLLRVQPLQPFVRGAQLRRRRFQHVDRSCVPDNWHPCRGTEMDDDRIAAHLALMATFESKNQAKALMTTTVATIFGDDAWTSRNEAELIATQRMFSSGAVSLVDTLGLAFDAYGANDGSMPFFDSMGGALEAAGLVQVVNDVLVDGWRLEAARESLEAQGYSDDSHAMRALAVENILVVWLNLALSDPVLKERIPCFVCVCRVQKSRRASRVDVTDPSQVGALLLGRVRQRRARALRRAARRVLGGARRPPGLQWWDCPEETDPGLSRLDPPAKCLQYTPLRVVCSADIQVFLGHSPPATDIRIGLCFPTIDSDR